MLTTLVQNWLTTGVQSSGQIVDLKATMERMKAVYYNESVGTVATDEELAQLSEYKHLDNARVVALETAIEAMLTALGDFTTGQAGNFLKAAGTLK